MLDIVFRITSYGGILGSCMVADKYLMEVTDAWFIFIFMVSAILYEIIRSRLCRDKMIVLAIVLCLIPISGFTLAKSSRHVVVEQMKYDARMEKEN